MPKKGIVKAAMLKKLFYISEKLNMLQLGTKYLPTSDPAMNLRNYEIFSEDIQYVLHMNI